MRINPNHKNFVMKKYHKPSKYIKSMYQILKDDHNKKSFYYQEKNVDFQTYLLLIKSV